MLLMVSKQRKKKCKSIKMIFLNPLFTVPFVKKSTALRRVGSTAA
jgi:hypothetical protein